MKDALLYDRLDQQRVQCHVCQWNCIIRPGERGQCRTRENRDGMLYSLIYDQVSSVCLDPIEKKPLYHFYPGTRVFSLGTVGCSFACPGCQNWQISRSTPLEDDPSLDRLTPAQAVDMAVHSGAAGICWTYNDPAIWLEHTVEGAKLAKEHGLYTAYVTNGTATREHLDTIGPYLDAYRVDIKAFSRESYKTIAGYANFEKVLDGVQYAHERWNMHLECVTNITPTVNDSDDELRGIARWIAVTLGVDTPWHVTRFYPYEGFAHLPVTPLSRIDRAYAIGHEEGLRYVYVGNVPGDGRQDTCCPSCKHPVIRRVGFTVAQADLRDGVCPKCGTAIAGCWK
ncbi:MAG TPA: AmmeMemoRadiSam system radical SAM enzyme [Armatimonadota bacterium]|nr:AmmeMemoRadiSam system radical SAM enzyme [Armatimonadota bacterium]